jgi:hypothetical protein
MEGRDRKMLVQNSPGQKCEMLSKKITKAKRAGGMVQVVELLATSTGPEFKPQNCQKTIIIS